MIDEHEIICNGCGHKVLMCVFDSLRNEYFCFECVDKIGHEPPFNAREYDSLPLTNNKGVV